ncbi:MAG: methionine--tRNA ligase [Bacteroidetes bacterium]|nr:methionine--tRNA ligase [Bacteroidota bacterium]MCL5034731.1 methionine--tRNA ligase [Bacteroidota bacterium]
MLQSDFSRTLVTAALPYANGPIHLGHLAGAYLPADIYVRYLRLKGEDVVFICGSDEHGVAVTITAEKEGTTPQEIVDRYHFMNKESFEKFGVSFDNYSRTTLPVHHQTGQEFFLELYRQKILVEKSEKQLYCENDRMFLADRYVEGTCPVCGNPEARGDQCEKCGTWLEQTQLIDPKCKICGATPVVRETKHWYFPLGRFQKELEKYVDSKKWKENVSGYIDSWLKEGLEDRAITRDLHWGIPVPLQGYENKVIYVWFEAVLGYISSTKELSQKRGEPDLWKKYWQDGQTRYIAFIGKDNIVFHTLIFPAILMAWNMGGKSNYILPDTVPANEFLNFEGKKFSKSRGWGIDLKDFIEVFPADTLRYSLALSLPESRDSDFYWKDFQARVNNELADTLGNFVNRTLQFVQRYYDGKIPARTKVGKLDEWAIEQMKKAPGSVGNLFGDFRFRDGVVEAMSLARAANKYFNDSEPWRTRKDDPEQCATTINICAQLTRSLAILLSPVLPNASEDIWKMLKLDGTAAGAGWDNAAEMKVESGKETGDLKILFTKIEDSTIEEQIRKTASGEPAVGPAPLPEAAPIKPEISIDDFRKVDLRVAKIVACEKVQKSEKLLKLEVQIGKEKRQIVAGISKHYKPEDLVGKNIIVVANLAPAKLMGLESNGMLLAASTEDGKLTVLTTATDIDSGSTVR